MKKLLSIFLMGTSFFSINAQNTENNPLLKKWGGPYGGVPAFNEYQITDFKPAIEFAIQEKLNEIDVIANNTKAPNFENTIVALEKSGEKISNIQTVYGIYRSNLSSAEFSVLDREMSPMFSAYRDKINQNNKLFKRIETLYNSKESKKLSAEQQRLIWLYYTNFVRQGAKLNEADKSKVAKINTELASHFTQFSQNLLAEESNQYLALETEADFDGLPSEVKNAAIIEAKERKLNVLGCIANTRSSIEPFLTFSTRRELREKAFNIFVKRGDNENAFNNNATALSILRLRADKAKILGFESFANWNLTNTMAKEPQNTLDLMMSVWNPAVVKVKEDVADMQKIVDAEGNNFKIQPWDYRFYAEKVRKAKFDLDQNEVKQYLQLENLREGMFWLAGELFNLNFKQVTNVPVYHADVRVWEVINKTTGKTVGLWYFDPYSRAGKRSGAWMSSYRVQEKFNGDILPIVSNNCNFIRGNENEPTLISWDDATTLFHEFGHGLHGLCSDVNYPSLSGTSVTRDYVEFPSQILERWLATPEILNKFALHYKTNEPMSQSLLDRIEKASSFGEGFATVETISSSLIDMKLHLANNITDLSKFEKETLDSLNMPSEIVMRHRIPQFSHIFSSDGYAAGYYSYLWADVINADAWDAFLEGKGPYDKDLGAKLIKTVFSVGNTIDPAKSYENFRGRAPQSEALMKSRNFPISDKM